MEEMEGNNTIAAQLRKANSEGGPCVMRVNTAVVDLASCVPRPSLREVEKIMKSEMKINVDEVDSIEMHHVRNCVLITFKLLDAAEKFITENNMKHRIRNEQSNYLIPVYMEDNAIDVRIHDLPRAFSPRSIERIIGEYGEVLSIRHDTWKNFFPGVYNGVRIVRMRLTKPIPSFVTFAGRTYSEQSLVTYKNQRPTCQWCGLEAHPGKPCNEAVKRRSSSSKPSDEKTNKQPSTKPSSSSEATKTTTQNPNAKQPTVKTATEKTSAQDTPAQTKDTSPDTDTNDFKTVDRETKRRLRKNNASIGSDSEISASENDTIGPEPAAGKSVCSPPRKKITTRSTSQNAPTTGKRNAPNSNQ
ncbi:uncharacterized protein LOC129722635 [Wyeomyia smithii]|uniref:uncharacterized protein LOC129722635 n=1 Tax=Wyeomyia smithii TaxID=174621 RepID=UPI002467D09F|nr:uncharacterized protein LOC129722635 [Wyeomyia smithii]